MGLARQIGRIDCDAHPLFAEQLRIGQLAIGLQLAAAFVLLVRV
jgi:hypothetical protein